MNFSEFLKKFYWPKGGGGLGRRYKSQKKIPAFFFEFGSDDTCSETVACPTDGSCEKWFAGDRTPEGSTWSELLAHFDEGKLYNNLLEILDTAKLTEMMERFGIILGQGEFPEKSRFANAVAVQFKAIALGGGVADNIVPEQYKQRPEPVGFGTYLQGAVNKHKWMRILGEDECLLSDHFICNRIGTTSAVFSHRSSGIRIENATLNKLRTYDRRGETRHVILIAGGGYGKTLMLQHLFLEAANQVKQSGLLPILVELRNFSYYHNDLLFCIVNTVKEYDPSFTEDDAKTLLSSGRCQILLDGADEMDPSDINLFQHKLAELNRLYPDNQIVITSRECDDIKGIRGFVRLYLHPFDNEQSIQLIDNLLAGEDDAEEIKEKIFRYMDGGFIKKGGIFASNPMLLTFIVRNHDKIDEFSKNKISFYELVYDAMVRGHDVEKEAYDRIFRSVADDTEFTRVFREFCGESYRRGIFEFDRWSFEKLFDELRSKDSLENPKKCQLRAFQHDACATACMMFEQDSGIYYVDPGFQEYLFAKYYFHAPTDQTKNMGRDLWDSPLDLFRNYDAFEMLYQMTARKTEVCLYLPFLESVFKGKTEEEAFQQYLVMGYGIIKYSVLDGQLIVYCMKELGLETHALRPNENEPRNIILYLILKTLSEPTSIKIEVKGNDAVRFEGQEKSFYTGVAVNDTDCSTQQLQLERYTQILYNQKDNLQQMPYLVWPIMTKDKSVLCFGNDYEVDLEELQDDPGRLKLIVDMVKAECKEAFRSFIRVKEYYNRIERQQRRNRFK